jgi:hypothetical protein
VIGRRLPASGSTYTMPEQAGDYSGPVDIGNGKTAVYFLLPIARDADAPPGARSLHGVHSPPHVFRECPDGSLEIRESIGAYGHRAPGDPAGFVWHGYLDEGHVWRTV